MTDILKRSKSPHQSPENGKGATIPRGRVVQESIWHQTAEAQQEWREEAEHTRQELLALPPLDLSDEELDTLIDAELREVRKERRNQTKDSGNDPGCR